METVRQRYINIFTWVTKSKGTGQTVYLCSKNIVHIQNIGFFSPPLPLLRLHLMPEGKHNLHLRFAEEFNREVEEFLR